MKLFELTNLPNVSNTTHAQAFMRGAERGEQTLPNGQKVKILGSGVEGIAFTIPGEIGVVKVMTTRSTNLQTNPYLKYISVAQRYSGANPFLPRVTQMSKQHVDQETWANLQRQAGVESEPEEYYAHPPALLSFRMERLIPIASLDVQQLHALYTKAFGEELDEKKYRSPMQIVDKIEYAVNMATDGEIGPNAPAQLVGAIRLVMSVLRKTHSNLDLHSGNMMARMTTGGPQLVLTDPMIGNDFEGGP
jgi:hypothetical protein